MPRPFRRRWHGPCKKGDVITSARGADGDNPPFVSRRVDVNRLVIVAFALVSLVSTVPSISKTEPVSVSSSDSAEIASTAPETPIPESVWSLGVAVIGVALVFRRKAA